MDYDFQLKYHPGKANVVADALSRKSLHVSSMMVYELELLEKFRDMRLNVVCCDANLSVSKVDVKNLLQDRIQEAQRHDPELQELKE